ncbi:MAG: helix-turn-helix domain-containing protein [Gemmatimonadaceae bacterium]
MQLEEGELAAAGLFRTGLQQVVIAERLGRILDRGAVPSGFETEQWTLQRIAYVVQRKFGVAYHYRYLERPLKAHGFSVHGPASQARERDERLSRSGYGVRGPH